MKSHKNQDHAPQKSTSSIYAGGASIDQSVKEKQAVKEKMQQIKEGSKEGRGLVQKGKLFFGAPRIQVKEMPIDNLVKNHSVCASNGQNEEKRKFLNIMEERISHEKSGVDSISKMKKQLLILDECQQEDFRMLNVIPSRPETQDQNYYKSDGIKIPAIPNYIHKKIIEQRMNQLAPLRDNKSELNIGSKYKGHDKSMLFQDQDNHVTQFRVQSVLGIQGVEQTRLLSTFDSMKDHQGRNSQIAIREQFQFGNNHAKSCPCSKNIRSGRNCQCSRQEKANLKSEPAYLGNAESFHDQSPVELRGKKDLLLNMLHGIRERGSKSLSNQNKLIQNQQLQQNNNMNTSNHNTNPFVKDRQTGRLAPPFLSQQPQAYLDSSDIDLDSRVDRIRAADRSKANYNSQNLKLIKANYNQQRYQNNHLESEETVRARVHRGLSSEDYSGGISTAKNFKPVKLNPTDKNRSGVIQKIVTLDPGQQPGVSLNGTGRQTALEILSNQPHLIEGLQRRSLVGKQERGAGHKKGSVSEMVNCTISDSNNHQETTADNYQTFAQNPQIISDQRSKQSRNTGQKTISFTTIQNRLMVNQGYNYKEDKYSNMPKKESPTTIASIDYPHFPHQLLPVQINMMGAEQQQQRLTTNQSSIQQPAIINMNQFSDPVQAQKGVLGGGPSQATANDIIRRKKPEGQQSYTKSYQQIVAQKQYLQQAQIKRQKGISNSILSSSITPKITTNSERGNVMIKGQPLSSNHDRGYSIDMVPYDASPFKTSPKLEIQEGEDSIGSSAELKRRFETTVDLPKSSVNHKSLQQQLNNINIIIDRPTNYSKQNRHFINSQIMLPNSLPPTYTSQNSIGRLEEADGKTNLPEIRNQNELKKSRDDENFNFITRQQTQKTRQLQLLQDSMPVKDQKELWRIYNRQFEDQNLNEERQIVFPHAQPQVVVPQTYQFSHSLAQQNFIHRANQAGPNKQFPSLVQGGSLIPSLAYQQPYLQNQQNPLELKQQMSNSAMHSHNRSLGEQKKQQLFEQVILELDNRGVQLKDPAKTMKLSQSVFADQPTSALLDLSGVSGVSPKFANQLPQKNRKKVNITGINSKRSDNLGFYRELMGQYGSTTYVRQIGLGDSNSQLSSMIVQTHKQIDRLFDNVQENEKYTLGLQSNIQMIQNKKLISAKSRIKNLQKTNQMGSKQHAKKSSKHAESMSLKQSNLSSNSIEMFNKCCKQINQFIALTMPNKSRGFVPANPGKGQSGATDKAKNNQNQVNQQQGSFLSQQTYKKIIQLAKQLQFPSDFFKKNNDEIAKYLKTKDFLVMLRVRIHLLFNRMMVNQFSHGIKQGLKRSGSSIAPHPHTLSDILQNQHISRDGTGLMQFGCSLHNGSQSSLNCNFSKKQSPQKLEQSVIDLKDSITKEEGKEEEDPAKHNSISSNNLALQQQSTIASQNLPANMHTQLNFKFYTDATGNNHPVVRQILKRRSWLQRVDKIKNVPNAFEHTHFFWTQWRREAISAKLGPHQIYSKIDGNYLLTNKTNLYRTMSSYYSTQEGRNPFEFLPETFLVNTDRDMSCNSDFNSLADRWDPNSIWICKPGQNSNRGRGIRIFTNIDKIKRFLEQKPGESWVVQKYISRPILIGGVHWNNTPMRKFDIRMFGLAQIIDGIHFRGYFYRECYIRTSSYEFNLSDLEDRDVHLTNDAVQDRNEEYGKYEPGNKVSQRDFAIYLKKYKNVDFYTEIFPKMKQAIKDTLIALWNKIQVINEQNRLHNLQSCTELRNDLDDSQLAADEQKLEQHDQVVITSPKVNDEQVANPNEGSSPQLRESQQLEPAEPAPTNAVQSLENTGAKKTEKQEPKHDTKSILNKYNQFELLGYDFMIDEQMKVYLIEVNTNPCLDTSPCPLLQRLITQVLDQTFKVAVDPFLSFSEQKRQEHQYSISHEMSILEFQYEMLYSNMSEIVKLEQDMKMEQQDNLESQILLQNQEDQEELGGQNLEEPEDIQFPQEETGYNPSRASEFKEIIPS